MNKKDHLLDDISIWLKSVRFRIKITIAMIITLVMFGFLLSYIIGRFTSKSMLDEKKSKGVSLSVTLASRTIEPLLSYDFLNLKNLVDETVRLNKDVSYAMIIDKEEQVVAHTFIDGFPVDLVRVNSVMPKDTYSIKLITDGKDLMYDIAAPIKISGDNIGTVRIGISHSEAESVASRIRWTIYLITSGGILFGAVIVAWISTTVTQRIKTLHMAAKEVINGNLDVHANPETVLNCWELMNCNNHSCPAFGNKIMKCWYIAETRCNECNDISFKNKFDRCQRCSIYKKTSGDEIQELTDFFDIMVYTLKDRIQTLKATEERLQNQQQLLKMILDATPDYVTLQDTEMRYQVVNQAFCELVGKTESEIIGKTDRDILPMREFENNMDDNIKVLNNKTRMTSEFEITINNQSRWFHIVRLPIIRADGEVAGILCSSRDITDIKQLHDRLAKAQQMESIGQLAAGVAHEINTPLGIILGNVQLMLEDTEEGTELHENLLIIEKYTRICKKIVSDLLHFSRRTESVKRDISVNEIIKQVVSVVEHTYSLDRVYFRMLLSEGIPLIYGDPEKLEQVFMNLFRNAFDAIGSDGEILVTTGFQKESNNVVVTVADTGSGISPENKDKIFNPFFSTKSVGKGTGLGLSVSLGIIHDHSGSIEFESPPVTRFPWFDETYIPKSGTMFIIKLPITKKNTGG
ncbi:MAG: ATP-binding protein [Thermodesulfovibrionales bacterium]|nr:ATP-binding protein [Thermodesulfovibrionales bacterium]